MLFGIILDTFKELRKTRDDINEFIKTKCFVCGLSKSEIE